MSDSGNNSKIRASRAERLRPFKDVSATCINLSDT